MEAQSKKNNTGKSKRETKVNDQKRKAKHNANTTNDSSHKKRKTFYGNKDSVQSGSDQTKGDDVNSLSFKERRKLRKNSKDNSQVTTKAKSLWENIRM